MKILIVEDEQSLLKILSEQLKVKGWEVISASEGNDAIAQLDQEPDIVLLDILLPGITGIDVLRQIRAKKNNKELPVIILSNFDDLTYVEDAKKLGVSAYLVKGNVEIDNIIAAIEKATINK